MTASSSRPASRAGQPLRSPGLPPGRKVELDGRGTAFVREVEGPPGAPTVVLLHGWMATADLNWYPSYGPLGRHFSVLAPDLRGHGQGLHSAHPFRLEDCADDVAALARATGRSRVIVAGYSMGGLVAQLAWRRHPQVVEGLVLCSTAARFSNGDLGNRLYYGGLLGLSLAARLVPEALRRPVEASIIRHRVEHGELTAWASDQLAASDSSDVLRAGSALGGFDSGPWLGGIDVPTAVVVTTADRVVSPERQRALARAIPGASIHEVDGDHGVCVRQPERFVPVLIDACASVSGSPG